MSVLSMRKMGVRTVARRVAKRTAKGLTKSYVLGKPPPGQLQHFCKVSGSIPCASQAQCRQLLHLMYLMIMHCAMVPCVKDYNSLKDACGGDRLSNEVVFCSGALFHGPVLENFRAFCHG